MMPIHPFTFVIPEVLASNIGGAATLIGDPPSTIVGSHLNLGFSQYALNMAPLALLTMLVLFGLISLVYGGFTVICPQVVASMSILDIVGSRDYLEQHLDCGRGTIGNK